MCSAVYIIKIETSCNTTGKSRTLKSFAQSPQK